MPALHDSPPTSTPGFGPALVSGDLGTLAGYRVVRILGRGGMGAVYLGVDPDLKRRVALKVLLPKFAAKPAWRERFLKEARATAAIRSDHVVTVFAVSVEAGLPFLAMEYLRGQTLEKYLAKGPTLTLPQVLRIGKEIAAGLASAHALGVVHRDVKPANVWLEAPLGRVKLIDFGLAKRPGDGDVPAAGTPGFMAPEQAAGAAPDPRSDLFGLGVVLYRLAAGRLPFRGETPEALAAAVRDHSPEPVKAANPTLPAPLAVLIDKLLRKNPVERPASAAAVVTELGKLLAQLKTDTVEFAALPTTDDQITGTGLRATDVSESAVQRTAAAAKRFLTGLLGGKPGA